MKKLLTSFTLVMVFSFISLGLSAQNKAYKSVNVGTVKQGERICLSLGGDKIIGTSGTFQKDGDYCVILRDADGNSGGRTVAIGEVVTANYRYTVYAVVQ